MARRTKLVTIPEDPKGENRDSGKSYLVTEMSPFKAEAWALRALNIIAKAGVDVPQETMRAGMAGLASIAPSFAGFQGLDIEALKPLLEEMMECVSFKAGTEVMPIYRKISLDASDIEEVSTILRLRKEVLELHLGFSLAEKLRDFLARMKAALPTTGSTSPASSESSSPRG